LAEGPRFDLPDDIDGLSDLINPNVLDPLRDQSFVKNIKAAPIP
jgi:hypothetical protein